MIQLLMTKIIFAGDLIPKNKKEFHYSEELELKIKDSVLSLINLEAPITNSINPIKKTGNNFKARSNDLAPFEKFGFTHYCLANNHIMDYGEESLIDTINELSKNKYKYFGAGKNLTEAKVPILFEEKGLKFAFINACDKEFSIATDNLPGANPFDIIEIYEQVIELKKNIDKVFLIYHGGLEHYPLPTPTQRRTFRFLIDIGVDGIICHHTHIFGAYEYYKNKPIFYSLGNFYTPTNRQMPSEYFESAILTLNIEKDTIDHELFPIRFNNEGVFSMNNSEADRFNKRISMYNQILTDDKEYEKSWQKVLEERKFYYSNIISRFNNRYIKKLRKLKIIPQPSYTSKKALQLLNVLRCDAHRETLIDILEKEYRKIYEK